MTRVLQLLFMVLVAHAGALTLATAAATAHEDKGTKISPSQDLSVPRSWAGEWRITTTLYGGAAGRGRAVDDVTDIIRAGEPLGLSALARGGLAACSGGISDR